MLQRWDIDREVAVAPTQAGKVPLEPRLLGLQEVLVIAPSSVIGHARDANGMPSALA